MRIDDRGVPEPEERSEHGAAPGGNQERRGREDGWDRQHRRMGDERAEADAPTKGEV
jgi:hypothetical protein